MRDVEIREALVTTLRAEHSDPGENRIWSEFAVCLGASRVDVCLINGNLTGFEIKSPRDNLDRLPAQVAHYNRVLDYALVVSTDKYFSRIADRVPEWWGLVTVDEVENAPLLRVERQPSRNHAVDPLSIAQLLWRDEAFAILREMDAHHGLSRGTRWDVWDRLVETLTLDELRDVVRSRLKARPARPTDAALLPSGAR